MRLSTTHRNQLRFLLSLLLLLQGFFPMQLHTVLERDQQGRLVEVCTMSGTRTISADFDPSDLDQAALHHGQSPESERSAAMALSDLMSEATPDTITIDSPEPELATTDIPVVTGAIHSLTTYGLQPIRAPPVV